ncbi:MAG: exodeoxyribonuclease III [Candidatus Nomurabacteria bacterium]|jgi:exodeoxyribonuclease-3|nr:exodeoxyribonuclease III [Candidatus Nomurabacteria bacterium]
MKIFSWNVNGLRANIKKGDFMQFLAAQNPDILCMQETKAKRGQVDIDLPDYEEFWNDADRAGYSGTAIFVKKIIKCHPEFISGSSDGNLEILKQVQDDNIGIQYDKSRGRGVKNDGDNQLTDQFGDLTREGRVTTAEFEKFFLVNVYTPNVKRELERLEIREKWDAAFLQYLNKLRETKPVIFCGDLNVAHREIDLANPKQNVGNAGFTNEERAGFQKYLNNGFIDSFRAIHGDEPDQYTWWTWRANARARNIGWRIDYFMVDEKLRENLRDATIYPAQMGSDHCPVSIELGDL